MGYNVKKSKVKQQKLATIRAQTSPQSLEAALAELLSEVHEYLQRTGAKVTGAPLARYYDYQVDEVDLEAGFPVAKPVEGEGRVRPSELPGGQVATTVHEGPIDELEDAHDAIGDWVLERQRDMGGAPWEVYLTAPGGEGGMKTEVFWPLR